MIRKLYFKLTLLSITFLITFPLVAQKKAMDHTVYDSWKSISNTSITNDGTFVITVIREQEGNDYLLIKELKTKKELIIPRGYTYTLTPDQKYVITKIKAPYSVIRQAKIKKTAEEKMPKDSLAIITLNKFFVHKIPNVKSYKLGKDFSEYLAYTIDDSIKVRDKNTAKPYSLILRNIYSAKEDTIKNATEYLFSRNGKVFTSILKPNEKDSVNKPAVLYINLETYKKDTVSTRKTIYKGLALSESGNKLSFLATADSTKKEIKDYNLYYYTPALDSAKVVTDKYKQGMPDKWNVSENYSPSFSKNEERLFLGIAPIALPKDTTIPDFEKAQLDIWHWQDPQTPPRQLLQLSQKRKQSYLSYINLANEQFFQLATEEMPVARTTNEGNGRYVIGMSDLKYQLDTDWDFASRSANDIWILDLSNNTKKQIKTRLEAYTQVSPQGKYFAWYDLNDKQYYVYNLETNQETCLTCGMNINFWDEKHDTPSVPNPYGFAAWTENDEALFVYDAYDIWKLDPAGNKTPENITKGIGRENKLTFRYIKTDPESRFIKKNEKLLLRTFDNTSKEYGYYELNKSKLNKLILDKYIFTDLLKAKNREIYAYSKSNFNTSPDLYVTNNLWKTETRLSDINPQMRDYNWGTAELMSWTTLDNKSSMGIVYKPEDFNPAKKYPVMVYFYEKHSDGLYQYFPPSPSWSIINIPFYVSRGYIVFTPDVQYTTGHPGESAYNSVVSGVEELAKNSWVDKENIGIQGQSWGGYQTAYLITRTNIFKAAGAGAPVSNMFSAYGGIRWESGMSRQYQYEQTQSRIGATIWEAPELYRENSPVFFADKVQTPLLIMHNDNDGAVPWYQGIEYFMALRRLHKPVWMLQYNKEAHNLKERRNRNDLTVRLQQFFDHYLKGDPMPAWMKKGVPAIDKGIKYGFELE